MQARLQLSRAARRRLQRLDRKTRDADMRVRCRVILKVSQGLSGRAAAREVGCVPSTAARIVARFLQEEEASLFDCRVGNGCLKMDEDAREGLRQIILKSPEDFGFLRNTWSLEALARVAARVLGFSISAGHLWKILRELKVRCVDGDRKAVWLFLNLLRTLLRVYLPARRIHLILENYIIHKSRAVEGFLRTLGRKIMLYLLPPYCTEEKRIERLWRDVHDRISRNHRCRSLQEFLAHVCLSLLGIQTHRALGPHSPCIRHMLPNHVKLSKF